MNPWAALNFTTGWSVYGCQTKVDGVLKCIVVASTKVTTVQMNQTVSKASFDDGTFMETGWKASSITQNLEGDMATGVGDTYGEAMVDLFSQWDPDQEPAPELESHRVELDAGL
jgi:hypothetical protein